MSTTPEKLAKKEKANKKLLKLEKLMNTKSAKAEAKRRTKIIQNYLTELKKEL